MYTRLLLFLNTQKKCSFLIVRRFPDYYELRFFLSFLHFFSILKTPIYYRCIQGPPAKRAVRRGCLVSHTFISYGVYKRSLKEHLIARLIDSGLFSLLDIGGAEIYAWQEVISNMHVYYSAVIAAWYLHK